MSSKKMHTTIGVMSGVGTVYSCNQYMKSQHTASDYVGAIIGGYFGARLADIIDPPTSPNHRSVGHGLLQNAMILKWVASNIGELREECFKKAQDYKEQALMLNDNPLMSLLYSIISEAYLFIAGLAVGVIAGHVSHLALDATTPKFLPVIF